MSHALARLDAVNSADRRSNQSRYSITEAGQAALDAAGPSCDRLPPPGRPCLLDVGHREPCSTWHRRDSHA